MKLQRGVECRALKGADIPAVVPWLGRLALYRRYGFTGDAAGRALQTALGAGDLLRVCQAASDGPLGLAWCQRHGTFGRSPYLRLLAVREDAAGEGIGARLLQDLETELEGQSALYLLVSDFNTGAQRFYRRHGYAKVGELEDFVLPGVTELLYRKSLSATSAGSSQGR